MRFPFLVSTTGLVLFALSAGQAFGQTAKRAPTAKSWMQPKTPWGDPDFQGTWTDDDCIGTPMNRPANFGDRPTIPSRNSPTARSGSRRRSRTTW